MKAVKDAIGRTIHDVELGLDELVLRFTDGKALKLWDDGKACCESRHATTDDDLSAFVGATFLDAETREGPEQPDEYGIHETEFLIVTTSAGSFTVVNHNEHNGYYGGFNLKARLS